jgi:hypothetical protein
MKKSTVIIWTVILVDLLSGLLLTLQVPFARIGLFVKGLVFVLVLIICLTQLRQKTFYSVYMSIVILLVFWVTGFLASYFNNPSFDPIESLVVLNRYFFFLVMSLAFLAWSKRDSFEKECKGIFETFFVINNAFIFIGFFFKIKMLSTYDPYGEYGDEWRFGYKGLIWGQNAVAAIYTLGVAYFFREAFKYNQSKTMMLVTTCIASILVGTKATLLTLLLIGGYYLYKYRVKTLVLLVLPSLAVMLYFIILYWQVLQDKYLSFLVEKYQTMDFYSFLTSGRLDYLVRVKTHISEHWGVINFITGDAISYIEMDFFDLYFYFGLSSLLYLYLYFKIFFIRDASGNNKYVFLVWMSMAFVAGHIINSAVVPIFYLLFVFSGYNEKAKLQSAIVKFHI